MRAKIQTLPDERHNVQEQRVVTVGVMLLMGKSIGIDYIGKAIDELVGTLGVREPISFSRLAGLLRANRVQECIEAITAYMGLPIRVALTYVPAGYQRPGSEGGQATMFESASLARTARSGKGAESITAQVFMPENLPLYGTSQLKGLPIRVRVSSDCSSHPHTFVTVLAHEFAHVLLRSLAHPERDNEVYTDLAAMLVGFFGVMKEGRKTVRTTTGPNGVRIQTTTFGYLTDAQFDYAFSRVDGVLQKYRSIKDEVFSLASSLIQECRLAGDTLVQFRTLLTHLDANLGRRTRKRDSAKLVAFHRPGYTEPLESIRKQSALITGMGSQAALDVSPYTQNVVAVLEGHLTELRRATDDMRGQHTRLCKDCNVLRRNTGLFARMRMAMDRCRRKRRRFKK